MLYGKNCYTVDSGRRVDRMPVVPQKAPADRSRHRGGEPAGLVSALPQGIHSRDQEERPERMTPESMNRSSGEGSGFCFDYNSPRWRRLRARVLREAGHRCQWAKRYGRREQATHVHHIWPAEDFPEYAWCRWNLIALSQASHNAMHDRTTGKLSRAGEDLRRKTDPPSPSASRPAPE